MEKTMPKSSMKRYTCGEEVANAITHGIGAALAVAALVLLIVRAAYYAPQGHTAAYVTGFTLFGSSLIILYLVSTLYHALPQGAKAVFGILDHCSIYVLIAGTYTAFCLGPLYGSVGWTIFGIIWGCAVVGIVCYAVFGSRIRVLSFITYIPMGWLILFALRPLKSSLPLISFKFLVIGGMLYTLGTVFYALKKVKWMHSVWHLFVLAGSIMHFFSIFFSI